MAKITDIENQKRNKERVNVYLDGEFFRGMDALTIAQNRIKIGDEVSESEMNALIIQSDVQIAFDKALRQIEYRYRAKNELIRYLQNKGYCDVVIAKTIDKLAEYGYVNDERFCAEYVRSYQNRYGVIKIKADLKLLGIDDEIIEKSLHKIESQVEQAEKTALRYIKGKKNITKIKVRAYLARHGFTYDDISQAVSTLDDEGYFIGEEDYD